eukprot:5974916-Pyramimonas_sp.AAC.1
MQHHDHVDLPPGGEPSMLWYLEEIAHSGEGDPSRRYYNWAHQLDAGGDRPMREHFCSVKVLELAAVV